MNAFSCTLSWLTKFLAVAKTYRKKNLAKDDKNYNNTLGIEVVVRRCFT